MGRCEIRGIEDEVILKLGRLAKQKGISREEYLRRIIQKHVLESGIREEKERYEIIVDAMMDAIERNSEQLEELTEAVRSLESQRLKD